MTQHLAIPDPAESSQHALNPENDPWHYVPMGWDELNRGICTCGQIVRWQDPHWVVDDNMRVLLLTTSEAATVLDRLLRAGFSEAIRQVELQLLLQEGVE